MIADILSGNLLRFFSSYKIKDIVLTIGSFQIGLGLLYGLSPDGNAVSIGSRQKAIQCKTFPGMRKCQNSGKKKPKGNFLKTIAF